MNNPTAYKAEGHRGSPPTNDMWEGAGRLSAGVVELVDTLRQERSGDNPRVGASPTTRTKII